VKYKKAWDLQKQAQIIVENDPDKGFVFFLEHDPVVTFGKNADFSHLSVSRQSLESDGVDVVETDRGGQVTAHMPGQLVVYPVLNLGKKGLGPKDYVCKLEQAVINTLKAFGIEAKRDSVNPGVWVGVNKICAVGIRISRRVSLHGIALNVENDFGLFRKMTPCGISGRGVSSLAVESGSPPDMGLVKETFSRELGDLLSKKKIELMPFTEDMLQ
jgi:lipoate-protein ligase B